MATLDQTGASSARPRAAAHASRLHAPPAPGLRRLGAPLSALLIFAALWGLFLLAWHPWMMRWGSTPEERAMVLPGDAGPPSEYYTRAITINAPPSAVWPWLQAIGQDRAGFLSYDWLENLTGADIHNADALRPTWRQREVGDRVPMAGADLQALGGSATLLTIWIVEPEHVIADVPGRFVLFPRGEHATRLLLRERLAIAERRGLLWLVWDPMHFVMERRMLRGIAERAEGQPLVPPAARVASQAGWALAGLGVLGIFLARPSRRPWLVLPLLVTLPPLWLAHDPWSALAGLLAVGITVGGALVYGRRWWPPYLLLAAAVAHVLLLAADAYAAFGLLFLVLAAGFAAAAWCGGLACWRR